MIQTERVRETLVVTETFTERVGSDHGMESPFKVWTFQEDSRAYVAIYSSQS